MSLISPISLRKMLKTGELVDLQQHKIKLALSREDFYSVPLKTYLGIR